LGEHANADESMTTPTQHLYIALELSLKTWKLAFSTSNKKNPRLRTVEAGDIPGLFAELAKARKKFKLDEDVAVHSCYEAGRDGFWLHRLLVSRGIDNIIVDPGSIERSAKPKAKTDRLDARMLVAKLIRWHRGEDADSIWSVLRIPSVAAEAKRAESREWKDVGKSRTRLISKIKAIFFSHGIRIGTLNAGLADGLGDFRDPLDEPLPLEIRERLGRLLVRLGLLDSQIKEMRGARLEARRNPSSEQEFRIEKLTRLKAIGEVTAQTLELEFFWRTFNNRREVGAAAGLTGVPYASGDSYKEMGISKCGNARVRTAMIEVAWLWIRYQPGSKLTKWWQARFAGGNKTTRKTGITAVARKLLIALWRYLEEDLLPEGAVLYQKP